MGKLKIGTGVALIVGLVLFYALYNGVNTDLWDTTVISLISLVGIALCISGILDILGIRIEL